MQIINPWLLAINYCVLVANLTFLGISEICMWPIYHISTPKLNFFRNFACKEIYRLDRLNLNWIPLLYAECIELPELFNGVSLLL